MSQFEANLMCYVWPCLADIPVHLPHDPNVLVAIEEGKFVVFP